MEVVQTLRVRLLGDLQVDGCDPSRLGRRQLRTLLKILALHHDHPVSTDRLIEYVWGDDAPAGAIEQISVLVSRLRNVVGAERVQRTDAGYTLAVDWLDLDVLADYAAQAEQRLAQGAVGAGRAAASAGLSLVRGPLLADEADPWWALTERSASDDLIGRLRHAAAAASLTAGDWSDVISVSRSLLESDPYDETALRYLMEALSRAGRSASGLAAYAETRRRLAEDLGVDPSPETEALHTSILLGEGAGAPRPPASIKGPPELPGRETALADLNAFLSVANGGQGAMVLIEGDAGIGKSRLLDDWSAHLLSQGVCVVRVVCDELGQALPLQPLLDAVSDLVHRFGERDPGTVLGLEGAVLGPMIGFQTEPADAAQLAALTDPHAGQVLLFGALTGVFRRLGEREVLVLVVDDVHVADSATLRWLALAARHLADSRILIVAAQRSEERVHIPGFATLALEPLDLTAVAALVGADRAPLLHERSGGNPLFLTELAALDEEDQLPESIRHAVKQRCQRTGAAAATLRIAAVLGPDIDLDLLAAVTDSRPSELLDHLEVGLRRKFLVEEGPDFVFAHTLVREALAATVGSSRTAFIHRAAARTLGSRPTWDPLAVARHARLGGELRDAAAMLVVAAQRAVIRFDQEGALRLLDDAIAMHDTVSARLERARIHSMMARNEQANADLTVARSLGAGPEALEVAAWSAHFDRRFDEALRLADQGANEAQSDDVRTSCLALGGWVSLASGDLGGAQDRLETAVGAAPETSGRMAESWMAWLRVNQGRPFETLRLASQEHGKGLAVYRFPNAYGLMASVMGLAMLGRAEEALDMVDTLEDEVQRMGATRWTPRPLNLRGWIVRNLGGTSQADDLNRAAMEAAHAVDQAEPLANALLDLAAGRLLDEDLQAVGPLLEQASALLNVEHAFRWRHELRGRLLKARLDLASGDPVAARSGARALAADASALGTPRYAVQANLIAAMAAHRAGLSVDHDVIGHLLHALDHLAGLESWWITAEVAREFRVAQWDTMARRRVADLRAKSGDYAASLGHLAARRLG
jgi:DNA-binding SARP family transcriptional activator